MRMILKGNLMNLCKIGLTAADEDNADDLWMIFGFVEDSAVV